MQKICFVVPTLERGGMERVVSLLANYAVSQRLKVYVIFLIRDDVAYDLLSEVVVVAPKIKYKKSLAGKVRALIYLREELKNIKPAAVLSFSEVFNPLAIVAGRLAGTPIYISDRSSPLKKLRLGVEVLRKLLYPMSSGMIAQTEQSKKVSLFKKYNKNITVIPNPLLNFKQSSVPGDQSNDENIVITVGRLVPSKNTKGLIDIFYEVEGSELWQLWILGDGSERCMLEKYIYELGVESRVKIFGAVSDVEYYLSRAKIFCFTSLSEGFPNALSEALGFPLPCVAYDCPAGPADLIKDGENGYLVPLHDKQEFKERLCSLMHDASLRASLMESYEQHRAKYELNLIASKYLRFILPES